MPFVPDDTATAEAPAPAAGRFVPDAPAAPRTGAAAIPTEAEAAGKPYVAPAPAAPKPVYGITDQIKGAVEAGVNTATGVIGALIGGVTGMGQAIGENTGMMAPSGTLQSNAPGASKTPISLDEAMGRHAEGIAGALKRTVSGPMDLRQAQTPDTELGQQYTEALQPAMENLVAAAPLHGTMGPKGALEPVKQAAGDIRRGVTAPAARAGAEAAGNAVGQAARKVLPIDPELAKVAQIAGDLKHPIDVRPDQIIEGAKFSKLVGQASSDVPLSNSKTASNQVAFTRNLIDMLNPEEGKADRLTPEVFDTAMRRSGQGIGDIMAKTDVPVESVTEGVEKLRTDADKFATDNDKRILGNYIDELQSKAGDDGIINGTALKELNSEIGARARTEAGNDLGRRLNDLQDVIQDAVEKHVEPADATPLRDFRRQYAYGKMVEPLVAKTIDGKVSPAGLMARVTATKQGKQFMARSAGGPIGDLAKVGQLIKEPGSSGTAERSLVYGAIKDTAKTAAAAAGGYPAAAAYNTFGPKLTRAMVGKRAKKAAPPAAEPPPEPTTSPGAGPGTPPAAPAGPGPLGDLTPDWQTTPGAGGGTPRGGNEPGLVPAVGEKSITRFVPDKKAETPSKRAGSEIPAVPGRPGLPDSMLTGRPKETAGTARENAALQEAGAQEAMRQLRLKDEEAARKEIPVGEVTEGAPVEKPAKVGKIPVGEVTEGQPPIKTLKPRNIPVGEATEVEPIAPEHLTFGEKLPVGEATHLTPELIEADKKWRTDHKLGEEDAGRARDVARALGYDEKAVEAAARQHDNSPRAFDREIARITEEGQARENESKQAARGSEGDAGSVGAPGGRDRAAPVPVGEGERNGPTPVREGRAEPEPAPAVRAAGEQPRANGASEAGTGRGGAEPAGRQGQVARDAARANGVTIHEVPGGFEARRGAEKVGYLKDNLERGQAEQLGENANVSMVKVDKGEAGQGTGRALYEAFNEKHGGRILPSGKTEPSAWKLWKRNYPDKVDQFVKDEAQRIRDGADPGIVARNITDAEVRARVLKESERGPDTKPDDQPGAVRKEAGQEGVPEDGGALDKAIEAAQELDQNRVGATEAGGRPVTDFAPAKSEVSGLRVRDEIPNTGSIASSLDDYEVQKGVREVPFSAFPDKGDLSYYSRDEETRTKRLAARIEESGEINPLIVVVDDKGPYILEGGHRFDALRELGKESFPALVVRDTSALDKAATPRKTIGSAGAMDMMLREKFGDKLIQGLKDQGILRYAAEHPERPWSAATMEPGFKPGTEPHATLYYGKLTPEEVPKALMHELGEHFGMVRLLGQERYNVMLNELKGLKGTDEVKDSWAHVKKFYTDRDARITEGGTVFLREVAAHLVESHPDLPFVRRIVNEIRAFFYEHFGTTMGTRVDADLIRGLAAAALRKASTGDLPSMKAPVRVTPLAAARPSTNSALRRFVQ